MNNELLELLQSIAETQAGIIAKLEDIEYRLDRLDEAVTNISTPGRDYDTYVVEEL